MHFFKLSFSLLQLEQIPDQKYALALILASRLANPYLVFYTSKVNGGTMLPFVTLHINVKKRNNVSFVLLLEINDTK